MLLFPLFSPQACGIERSCFHTWLCPLPAVWLEGVTETLQSQVVGASVTQLCPVFGTPVDPACQPPLPLGILRHEFWSGCHSLSPGDFSPAQGLNPGPCAAGRFFTITSDYSGSPQSHTVGKQDGKEVSLPLGCSWELTGPLAWSAAAVYSAASCDCHRGLAPLRWEPA